MTLAAVVAVAMRAGRPGTRDIRPLLASTPIPARTGGTVDATDRGSIAFPAGALSRDAMITVREDLTPFVKWPGGMSLGPALDVQLGGARLVHPARMEMSYRPEVLPPGTTDDEIFIVGYDEGKQTWVPVPSTVDRARSVVSAEVGHFSKKAVGTSNILDGVVAVTDWIVYNSGLVLTRTRPPTCARSTAPPRWVTEVYSPGFDPRFFWCTESDGEGFMVRIRNNRPFAQKIEFPDLVPVSFHSGDLWSEGLTEQSFNQSKRVVLRSGQEMDLSFSRPTSGPPTRVIQAVPHPDILSTLGVLAGQYVASKTTPLPDANTEAVRLVLAHGDCVTSIGGSITSGDLPRFLEAQISLLKQCVPDLFGDKALGVVLTHQAITSIADLFADTPNNAPEFSFPIDRTAVERRPENNPNRSQSGGSPPPDPQPVGTPPRPGPTATPGSSTATTPTSSTPTSITSATVPAGRPPAAPTQLSVAAICPGTFSLAWRDNSDNEDGFRVYDSGTAVRTTGRNTPTVSIQFSVLAGSQHRYTVAAYNQFGESARSNEVPISKDCAGPPAAPSNLTVTPFNGDGVMLRWRDNSTDEEGFEVASESGLLIQLPANTTSMPAQTGANRRTCWRVRATNKQGASAWTDWVCATTPPP